ncbi:hypothetical protein DFR68_104210 [Nocardia mexicana]|uniref:Uncharacterized protein n=1 Tax=Nocardia mexicana TaxID=279262 RepID=A0A370H5S1_9NOCA|nr:hypothetical protein DFR68_104210 [Nocardia mexicana]
MWAPMYEIDFVEFPSDAANTGDFFEQAFDMGTAAIFGCRR